MVVKPKPNSPPAHPTLPQMPNHNSNPIPELGENVIESENSNEPITTQPNQPLTMSETIYHNYQKSEPEYPGCRCNFFWGCFDFTVSVKIPQEI
ncbi:uncharacterized protein L201_003655 [Kwoniella dendrophila CBS 6074]|uniref:Uncharacterized protein n=1 Tax=Kwoniella dendrophila CBS 6074 TaxID=1295534 RepID=A0AAX4JTQ8_9TREE